MHSIDETVDVSTSYRNITLSAPATINNAGTTINVLRLDTGGGVTGPGTLTLSEAVLFLRSFPGNT